MVIVEWKTGGNSIFASIDDLRENFRLRNLLAIGAIVDMQNVSVKDALNAIKGGAGTSYDANAEVLDMLREYVYDVETCREAIFDDANKAFCMEDEAKYSNGESWFVVCDHGENLSGYIIYGDREHGVQLESSDNAKAEFRQAVEYYRERYEAPDTREQDIPSVGARNRIVDGRVV